MSGRVIARGGWEGVTPPIHGLSCQNSSPVGKMLGRGEEKEGRRKEKRKEKVKEREKTKLFIVKICVSFCNS